MTKDRKLLIFACIASFLMFVLFVVGMIVLPSIEEQEQIAKFGSADLSGKWLVEWRHDLYALSAIGLIVSLFAMAICWCEAFDRLFQRGKARAIKSKVKGLFKIAIKEMGESKWRFEHEEIAYTLISNIMAVVEDAHSASEYYTDIKVAVAGQTDLDEKAYQELKGRLYVEDKRRRMHQAIAKEMALIAEENRKRIMRGEKPIEISLAKIDAELRKRDCKGEGK